VSGGQWVNRLPVERRIGLDMACGGAGASLDGRGRQLTVLT
jgi:hypothetical protein